VFKARHIQSDKIVAVKIISLEDESALSDVCKEIEALQQCKHPNIVNYIGSHVGLEDNTLWIVMEYCGGGSVSDLLMIRELPLSQNVISYIVRQSLRGIKYLHDNNRIHRDIKGGNILLTETGKVKLGLYLVRVYLPTRFVLSSS
jgi:serine/threonine protein kinase